MRWLQTPLATGRMNVIVIDMKMQLVRRLRIYKAEQNFTQAEMAIILNTSQPRVSEMLKNKLEKYSLDFLVQCVENIGLTPTLVFKGE